jgi:L-lactate dehydrogenase complex protein LldG
LRQLLVQFQPRSALCWEHPALEKLRLADLLAVLSLTAFSNRQLAGMPEQERRETILAAGVGISSVDFAISETGTLVVCARSGQERVVSLVPPVHVAVVAQDQILPDLFDLFTELDRRGIDHLPGNLVLITGPSKTGDIELELTTGIHGPGEWHVIVVRENIASPISSADGR